jgi:hypothetical protein
MSTSHTFDQMWDGCVRCGATAMEMVERGGFECSAPENVVSAAYLEWKRHERDVLKPLIDSIFKQLRR